MELHVVRLSELQRTPESKRTADATYGRPKTSTDVLKKYLRR